MPSWPCSFCWSGWRSNAKRLRTGVTPSVALPYRGRYAEWVVPALVCVLTNGRDWSRAGGRFQWPPISPSRSACLALKVAPRRPSRTQDLPGSVGHRGRHGRSPVIALFYTGRSRGALGMAGLILLLLIALNVLRVRRLTPYLVLMPRLWFFVHESGVHATIADVLPGLDDSNENAHQRHTVLGQGSRLAGLFRSLRDWRCARVDQQEPARGDRPRLGAGEGVTPPGPRPRTRPSRVLSIRRDAALCVLEWQASICMDRVGGVRLAVIS